MPPKKSPPPEEAASRKIWRDALALLEEHHGDGDFTAGDLVGEFDLLYAGAAQLLKRLQVWGYIRVKGFAPAVHENPKGGHGGRQRKVYVITEHGKRAARYRPENA